MAVRNITTQIAPEKTISEIIKILSQFGAKTVIQNLDKGGNVTGISFVIEVKDGMNVPIKLPMKVDQARQIIVDAVEEGKLTRKYASEPYRTAQAMRVGWRVIKDWIHSQLSLIQMNYAKPIEIFLPYVYDIKQDKTMYEYMLPKLSQIALEHKET